MQALDVARGSLDLATKLVTDNRARVEVGTLAPLDVVQAQAEEATRRQALAQADAQSRTAELALKRLIVSGTDDPALECSGINPVDRPTFLPDPLDVQSAVRKALDNRTDLQIARKTIDSNDVTLKLHAQPDAAGARPHGDVRRQRSRWHAVPAQRQRRDQPGHRRCARRILRCVAHAHGP